MTVLAAAGIEEDLAVLAAVGMTVSTLDLVHEMQRVTEGKAKRSKLFAFKVQVAGSANRSDSSL